MKVKLPRSCSGTEVVKAFKEASTIVIDSEYCLRSREFLGGSQYTPASARVEPSSKGVTTESYVLKKEWLGLFGKKIWMLSGDLIVTLEPLTLQNNHEEVNVDLRYCYDTDEGGFDYVVSDPLAPEFDKIRPHLEKVLQSFIASLTNPQ